MTRLVLKAEPPVRLAVDGLIPERLAGLSPSEIERLPLALGNRRQSVAEWFRIEPSDGATLEIVGDCRRLDKLGSGMSEGAIALAGSAGYGAATDMRGGLLRIAGDAGDALGGALPGAAGGMRDGTVLVAGRAGAEAGRRLRRGLIVIGGRAGPFAGAAMRRGSMIALGGVPRIGPTFADGGVHDLIFLRLLARHLTTLGLDGLATRLGGLRRWTGDAAVGGAGELLVGK